MVPDSFIPPYTRILELERARQAIEITRLEIDVAELGMAVVRARNIEMGDLEQLRALVPAGILSSSLLTSLENNGCCMENFSQTGRKRKARCGER